MILPFSIILSIILGVLLHFLYKISNYNTIIGFFSATNESIWEHLKLSFFSIIIVGILEWINIKGNANNFWLSKMVATIFAMLFTIISFYTYSGIIGKDNFIIDIGIFIISIILAEIISYKVMYLPNLNLEIISEVTIISIVLLFARFTLNPPRIPLFQDPISKKYGIEN